MHGDYVIGRERSNADVPRGAAGGAANGLTSTLNAVPASSALRKKGGAAAMASSALNYSSEEERMFVENLVELVGERVVRLHVPRNGSRGRLVGLVELVELVLLNFFDPEELLMSLLLDFFRF